MKVVMLYRERSDHRRDVETYVSDIKRRTGNEVELIDIDSREGARIAQLYGIMQYPALLVTRDTGELQQDYQGVAKFPTINDISFYLRQV